MEEIDLKELFTLFWNRRMEILLITLIAMVVGVAYSYFLVKPVYNASTTLVLAQTSSTADNKNDGAITQSDLALNSKLVATYSELIKSKSVLRQVVDNFKDEDLDEEKIKKNVSVQSVNDTEVIKITVKNADPNLAAQIANKISEVFTEKVVEIYNISNVNIIDRAEPEDEPSNVNHIKDIIIFAFIGVVIAVGFVLVLNMLDTTIKTEQDIENISGLLVLSSIPDYDVEQKKSRERSRR